MCNAFCPSHIDSDFEIRVLLIDTKKNQELFYFFILS